MDVLIDLSIETDVESEASCDADSRDCATLVDFEIEPDSETDVASTNDCDTTFEAASSALDVEIEPLCEVTLERLADVDKDALSTSLSEFVFEVDSRADTLSEADADAELIERLSESAWLFETTSLS